MADVIATRVKNEWQWAEAPTAKNAGRDEEPAV